MIGGFVAAHLMNKDPRGHEVLAEVDARITEFADRIGEAYREQESRITGIVDGVKDAAGDAYGTARDSVAAAASTAVDAASSATDAAVDAARKLTD